MTPKSLEELMLHRSLEHWIERGGKDTSKSSSLTTSFTDYEQMDLTEGMEAGDEGGETREAGEGMEGEED